MGPGPRLAIFGLVALGASCWAAAEAGLLLWRLRGRRAAGTTAPPCSRAVRWRRGAGLALGATLLACVTWGGCVEPRMLSTTRLRVEIRGLAAPLRLVHLSDLHCDTEPGLEARVADATRAERPDLVCLTGDYLNRSAALPRFHELATALAAIAPCYAVRGNWEAGLRAREELFEGTGVIELAGEAARFEARGARIVLAGLPWFAGARAEDALRDAPRDAPIVFLFHSPDLADDAAAHDAALQLSGHTHGGQVRLPWYGALVTLAATDKRFEMGRYEVGAMTLFVTRGVGTSGVGPPVRFLCPPEIAVLDLVPPDSPRSR
jgi:predicted MPP superfamily phosphohydrolase